MTANNCLIDSFSFVSTSAFNRTMERLSKLGDSLKNFTYKNKEIADEIYAAVNSTQFLGVSVCRAAAEKIAPSLPDSDVEIFSRRATSRSARRATGSL